MILNAECLINSKIHGIAVALNTGRLIKRLNYGIAVASNNNFKATAIK